jgi:DNA-binding beta-propeller fold protein YncE
VRRLAMAPSVGSTGAAPTSRGFVAALGASLLAFALILLFAAAPAMAGKGTVAVFNASGPRGVAVNQATGNVYVMEQGKVGVYDADGNPLFEFGSGEGPEPGQFGNTAGLAINQTTGHVYTLTLQQNYRVDEFDGSGNFVRMWGADVNATLPGAGFEVCAAASGDVCQAGQNVATPGGFSAEALAFPGMYLTVDPATGAVVVADGGNKRLQVFSSTGDFVRLFGSKSVFPGHDSPSTVAIDSLGSIYTAGYLDVIKKFNSEGEPLGLFGPGVSTTKMAIDPSDDHVYTTRQDEALGEWEIAEYDPSGALVEEHAIGIPEPTGIAVSSATGRIYVTDKDGGRVMVIDEVGAMPLATVDPATEITPTSVRLNGTINPEGTSFDTKWRFICTPACPGLTGGNAGNGTTDVPVSEAASGLDPNTTYQVRLVATREFGAGQTVTSAGSFTTAATEPVVSLVGASRVTDTTARLGAAIDAKHSATAYYFQYGTSTSYGGFGPGSKAGNAGQLLGAAPVFERITGLTPETTYHFKLVAENSAGEVESEDIAFTTRSTAEAAFVPRGIELATPPDKGNQNPAGFLSNDGEKVIWSTLTGTPGASAGKYALFAAERSSTGWDSHSLVPKPEDLIGGGEMGYGLAGASDDYSKVIYQVGERGANTVESEPFTFVRFNPVSSLQQTLDYFPEGGALVGDGDAQYLASTDTGHFFVWVREAPEEGSLRQAYDLGEGSRRLVTVMPETDEKPACGAVLQQRYRTLSDDGSRFYFMSRGDDCSAPLQIYLRDDQKTASSVDDTTTRISTPAVAGPEGEARVVQTNAPGDSIVYYSAAKVTGEDGDETADLYRWTLGKGNECLTCMVANIGLELDSPLRPGNLLVSEDLSHVYVSTVPGLVPGEGEGDPGSLYLIVDGELKYVSKGDLFKDKAIELTASMTPSGDVLVFYVAESGITADATGGFEQYYLYSERSDSVECISCAPPGAAQGEPEERTPAGAAFGEALTGTDSWMLSEDGSTFAFNTPAALVPEDANGGPDIYEWHNGTIRLVTDGEGEYGGDVSVPLRLSSISADGKNILFRVAARLTGFERDDVGQLFVARLGGGFPPPRPGAGCDEDACQGPLEGAPTFAQPGSAAIAGPGDTVERKPPGRPRCRKGTKRMHPRNGKARCTKTNSKRRGKASSHKAGAAGKNRSGK